MTSLGIVDERKEKVVLRVNPKLKLLSLRDLLQHLSHLHSHLLETNIPVTFHIVQGKLHLLHQAPLYVLHQRQFGQRLRKQRKCP
jgi:hypothetical protein